MSNVGYIFDKSLFDSDPNLGIGRFDWFIMDRLFYYPESIVI